MLFNISILPIEDARTNEGKTKKLLWMKPPPAELMLDYQAVPAIQEVQNVESWLPLFSSSGTYPTARIARQ